MKSMRLGSSVLICLLFFADTAALLWKRPQQKQLRKRLISRRISSFPQSSQHAPWLLPTTSTTINTATRTTSRSGRWSTADSHTLLQLRGGNLQNNSLPQDILLSESQPDSQILDTTTPTSQHKNENHTNTLLTPNSTRFAIQQMAAGKNQMQQYIPYNPLRLYQRCMGIVATWIAVGTLFYATVNHWPWPQSFFYAVDAGMSIGFCTNGLAETRTISKAFTILYILWGASVVGGALSIFLQYNLQDFATPTVQEYQLLLERQAFDAADVDHSGVLTKDQFTALLQSTAPELTRHQLELLWTHFDRLHDGVIHFEQEFAGNFRSLQTLVKLLQERSNNHNPLYWLWWQWKRAWHVVWGVEHRIYFVLLLWMSMGIAWGMLDQQWDFITATHFAVSALATGGLTGPSVNPEGILPADPSLFCGIFCLFGIPLFGLALGHFAKVLVASHLCAMETAALSRPMTKAEYEVASQLVTDHDSMVHLSDYIVLQLLRQGKLSVRAIELLKQNFEVLDTDKSGMLTLEQATFDHTLHATQAAATDSPPTESKG